MEYQKNIDGIRAIAVLAVVLFHFHVPFFPGGFAGVDIFFVISGYLITERLFQQVSTTGLSLSDFYSRRIRRILPALLVMLVASLGAGYFIALPSDYASLASSAIYSTVGTANFYYLLNTGYFDRQAELLPLLHMWSLAVEEQFYLVWPLLLAGFMWVTGGSKTRTAWLTFVLIVISFALGVHATAVDPKGAFYLPHTRAWELALGALLVLLPVIQTRRIAEVVSLVGFGLVGYAIFGLKQTDPFPGVNALYPCLGAALLIWSGPRTIAGHVLATSPMRFVGLISYSLYLWHWPVLVFFRLYANSAMPTLLETVVLLALAFALSVLSWRFVEQPFRRPAPNRKVIAIGAAAVVAVVLVSLPVVWTAGIERRISPQTLALQLTTSWNWNCPQLVLLPGLDKAGVDHKRCAVGLPWEDAPLKGVLWGDSHSEHTIPLLESVASRHNAAVALYRACPAIIDNASVTREWPEYPGYNEECAKSRDRLVRHLKERSDINLVVLTASWTFATYQLRLPDSPTKSVEEGRRALRVGLDKLIQEISAPGRRIAIVADVPQWQWDPVSCALAQEPSLLRRRCTPNRTTITRKQYEGYQRAVAEIIREAETAHAGVVAIIPGDGLCPQNRCRTQINGEFLYRDSTHLRRNFTSETKDRLVSAIGLERIFDTIGAATPE